MLHSKIHMSICRINKEQKMMGVVMPLERSFYNPERLYETWLKIDADGDFRQELEKDDVLFDLENKAISDDGGDDGAIADLLCQKSTGICQL